MTDSDQTFSPILPQEEQQKKQILKEITLDDFANDDIQNLPPRIVLYGVHGIGKSTFGSILPKPIFLQTEDGLRKIKVKKLPLCKTWLELDNWSSKVAQDKHDFQTLVIDTLDWAQSLLWRHICDQAGKKHILEIPFGKGYGEALAEWATFIKKLDYINVERKMAIVCLAHSNIVRYENPETQAYDRYSLSLREDASKKFMEWADAVLFVNYVTHVQIEEKGFGKEEVRGVGQGERRISTQERPGFFAKNKYGLPFEFRLGNNKEEWARVWSEMIKYF